MKIEIVNDHNEAVYHWAKLEQWQNTLLHIDGHNDMSHKAKLLGKVSPTESMDEQWSVYSDNVLKISDFICSAVHYGIVNQVYWINPQVREGRDLVRYKELETKEDYEMVWWKNVDKRNRSIAPYDVLSLDGLKEIKSPWILDIDLDAFCCDKLVQSPSEYELMQGLTDFWELRLRATLENLMGLPAPEVVTVARSQGPLEEGKGLVWVPPSLVDKVQEMTVERLTKLYS
ncbi:hypothetical protein HOC13_01555 [Candidatus Woesearchaeota archaeon]|jgi:hypothetical protein|nr:hypothetical protein [Candidatus Woesearchaeota archaeon]